MEKTNSKINLRLTSREKEQLENISESLGCSLNFLCRSILNSKVREVQSLGIQEFSVIFERVEIRKEKT